MKKLILAGMVAAVGTLFMLAPVEAATVNLNSKYCRNNLYDPLCMDSKMMKMRKNIMGMTKTKVMANRSKYCRNNISDPICSKKMMKSTVGY